MQKHDMQDLADCLYSLAETFDRPPVGPKALPVWFETLREFPTERVIPLLKSWPKTHGKMPVPAEVWRILNESGIDERERAARSEKARLAREIEEMPRSVQGEKALAMIAKILKGPRRTPVEHWRNVMETPGLPDISYEYAKLALHRLRPNLSPGRERVPGEDDE